jgi:hypothetical protein
MLSCVSFRKVRNIVALRCIDKYHSWEVYCSVCWMAQLQVLYSGTDLWNLAMLCILCVDLIQFERCYIIIAYYLNKYADRTRRITIQVVSLHEGDIQRRLWLVFIQAKEPTKIECNYPRWLLPSSKTGRWWVVSLKPSSVIKRSHHQVLLITSNKD